MHRRSSALSRTTWRTIETTVAAEIRDAKEGRLWLKRRPVASRGSHLTLLCIMAKARCSVPVAAPESSHVLSTMTTEAPVRSGPAQNRAGRHRGSSPRPGGENTPWPCRPDDIEFDVTSRRSDIVTTPQHRLGLPRCVHHCSWEFYAAASAPCKLRCRPSHSISSYSRPVVIVRTRSTLCGTCLLKARRRLQPAVMGRRRCI